MSSGSVDKAKGRVKKAVADLVDDPKLRRRGKVDEAAGKAKDAVERGIDQARDKINKR